MPFLLRKMKAGKWEPGTRKDSGSTELNLKKKKVAMATAELPMVKFQKGKQPKIPHSEN